jgi:hypothetical protein
VDCQSTILESQIDIEGLLQASSCRAQETSSLEGENSIALKINEKYTVEKERSSSCPEPAGCENRREKVEKATVR